MPAGSLSRLGMSYPWLVLGGGRAYPRAAIMGGRAYPRAAIVGGRAYSRAAIISTVRTFRLAGTLALPRSPSRTLASGYGCTRTASHGEPLSRLAGKSHVRYPIPIRPLSQTHDLSTGRSPAGTYPAIGVRNGPATYKWVLSQIGQSAVSILSRRLVPPTCHAIVPRRRGKTDHFSAYCPLTTLEARFFLIDF